MDFWLLDVKGTINMNGKDATFDYINTHFDVNEAINEAQILSTNKDILEISVHHWILNEDGTQEHATDINNTPYYYFNKNHRELKNVD